MSIKLKTLKLATNTGTAQPLLSLYDKLTKNIFSSNIDVEKKIQKFSLSNEQRKGYILIPIFTSYRSHCLRYCTLAHTFRANGYEPIILYDNEDLPIRSDIQIDNNYGNNSKGNNNDVKTELRTYRPKSFIKNFDFKSYSVSELIDLDKYGEEIDDESFSQEDIHNSIDITNAVKASTRRYLMEYSLELSDNEKYDIYKQFLIGGRMITDAIIKLFDKYSFDITLVQEVNYIHGRIPLKICEKNDTPLYNIGKGYHKRKVMFGSSKNKNPMVRFCDEDSVNNLFKQEMNNEKRTEVANIMQKRKQGKESRLKYAKDNNESIDSSEKFIVGIFSHLLWDGALEPEQAIYNNIYDWFRDTIEIGSEIDDTHFIIKPHPSEEIRGTNESISDWIDENYPMLPDNFTLLPPDTDIDAYSMMTDLDAGLVYASTVGLEMVYDGIPVLVGGYPPYRDYGISHDPKTKEKYNQKLRDIKNVNCTQEMQARAEWFAYYSFMCKEIELPYYTQSRLESDKQILIKNEELTKECSIYSNIVEDMLNGGEINESCKDL